MPGDELEVPAPLAQLAEIRRFKLFVCTTFDPLLARALDRVHGAGSTATLAYSPERTADLPQGWELATGPLVFHLLGRVSTEPSYAVTDEDVLEFFHALQSENRRPQRLLDTQGRRFTSAGAAGGGSDRLPGQRSRRHRRR